jgi:predicted RNA-binding Zn-ribbon protein involved in translation (DUF1610 family)
MSDDFDHEADALDRLLEGDGSDTSWVCPRCGTINSTLFMRCMECRQPALGLADLLREYEEGSRLP